MSHCSDGRRSERRPLSAPRRHQFTSRRRPAANHSPLSDEARHTIASAQMATAAARRWGLLRQARAAADGQGVAAGGRGGERGAAAAVVDGWYYWWSAPVGVKQHQSLTNRHARKSARHIRVCDGPETPAGRTPPAASAAWRNIPRGMPRSRQQRPAAAPVLIY